MSDKGPTSKTLRFADRNDDGTWGEAGRILLDWHATLHIHKGDRAALRRATSLDDATEVRRFAALRRSLLDAGFTSVGKDTIAERLAFVALLAADTDGVRDLSPGRWLAMPARAGAKPVHEARVRLLLGAADTSQMVRLLRSCLSILDQTAPLPELADLVMGWGHPDRRARMRRRIFLDYLDAVPDTATA